MLAAENTTSAALMSMKLEMYRLDRMPEITAQIMKPVEKIDSIRINQITGMGNGQSQGYGGVYGGANGSDTGGGGLNSGAALATVVGVLVEVPVMLTLVALINAWKPKKA